MITMKRAAPGLIVAILTGCEPVPPPPAEWVAAPVLTPQVSGTSASLIAVSVVDRDTVWVSGRQGTWARTTDGGATWHAAVVPGADSLQFRDVHALDSQTAWLLSMGNGGQSRIYRTSDAGGSWTLQFTNAEPDGFFDCFGFWDADHGIAFSDSFDGSFYLITTADGGATWTRVPADRLPPASPGEGAFASSGTCLALQGEATAWIGTGASEAGARVLRTADRGLTWSVANTPIVAGPAAGITSVAFRDAIHGVAVGGDIARPDTFSLNVAVTGDGGTTWTAATSTPFPGAAYASAWVPGAPIPTLVAVGPGGLAFSIDEAVTWTPVDTLNHWGLGFASPDAGWAVGPGGRITHLSLWQRSTAR